MVAAKKTPAKERKNPQFFYGPEGASRVFQPDEKVPAGWKDHPRKVDDFVDPLLLDL